MATKKAATSKKKTTSTTKKSAAKKTTTSRKKEQPVIIEQEIIEIVAPATVNNESEIDDAPIAKMTFGEKFAALKPSALIAEFLGTFVLAALVLSLATNQNYGVLGITLGLAALVMIFGNISGAHLNPAITVASYINRKIDGVKSIAYILVQFLGAVLAFVVLNAIFSATFNDSVLSAVQAAGYGDAVTSAGGLEGFATMYGMTVEELATSFNISFTSVSLSLDSAWTTFFSEVLGATIFGLGVGFAIFQKNKSKIETGLGVGLGLLGGLVIGGSAVILNPAVAAALGVFTKSAIFGAGAGVFWASLGVYVLGTVIGMTMGITAYRFIFKDAVRK